MIKLLTTSSAILGLSTLMASANSEVVTQVPEIDATSGALAVAAILAAVALVWEVKRRRA